MSLMYKINKTGPNIDPCGTPDVTASDLIAFVYYFSYFASINKT